MTESAPPEAKPQEDVGKRLTPRPRRAVYVTRVDNGGVEDTVIVGDDSVSPTGRDMVDQREDRAPADETSQDRWLRENVPPHW